MNKRVYLHVGTHKTGSTSIQRYLERAELPGYRYYSGISFQPWNHLELHLASIRPERMSPVELKHLSTVTDEYRQRVAGAVRRFLAETEGAAIFSSEDLCMLQHEDETAALARLFSGWTVVPIVFFRRRSAYLKSWRRQLRKMGIRPSRDPNSSAYAGSDGWRTDYTRLVRLYERTFGQVVVCDYDEAVRRDGTVIPELLRGIGIDPATAPPANDVRENVTPWHWRIPGIRPLVRLHGALPPALKPMRWVRRLNPTRTTG